MIQVLIIFINLFFMPFIKIWVHLVWATKNRKPLLTSDVDHVHCLIALNQEQTIAKVVQMLKGESSFWINKTGLCKEKFEWQDEYFAVSVSDSGVDKVRTYIKNQEAHHTKKTFQQEYDEFMEKFGFEMLRNL